MVNDLNSIRLLRSYAEIEIASSFLKNVWGGADDVVPVDVAIASGHVGGYFAGAFESDRLVAASYGFLGSLEGKPTLHSHVTASVETGAGYALKLHQREWAEARGLSAITWTFDPLVRRNCHFNFTKLGAVATEYLVNFYGSMNDSLNLGDESDRLFAVLSLDGSLQHSSARGDSVPAALSGLEGAPNIDEGFEHFLSDRTAFAVVLPEDIESLRSADPQLATQWRLAVRSVLEESFQNGATIKRMIENRAIVVDWPESSNS